MPRPGNESPSFLTACNCPHVLENPLFMSLSECSSPIAVYESNRSALLEADVQKADEFFGMLGWEGSASREILNKLIK